MVSSTVPRPAAKCPPRVLTRLDQELAQLVRQGRQFRRPAADADRQGSRWPRAAGTCPAAVLIVASLHGRPAGTEKHAGGRDGADRARRAGAAPLQLARSTTKWASSREQRRRARPAGPSALRAASRSSRARARAVRQAHGARVSGLGEGGIGAGATCRARRGSPATSRMSSWIWKASPTSAPNCRRAASSCAGAHARRRARRSSTLHSDERAGLAPVHGLDRRHGQSLRPTAPRSSAWPPAMPAVPRGARQHADHLAGAPAALTARRIGSLGQHREGERPAAHRPPVSRWLRRRRGDRSGGRAADHRRPSPADRRAPGNRRGSARRAAAGRIEASSGAPRDSPGEVDQRRAAAACLPRARCSASPSRRRAVPGSGRASACSSTPSMRAWQAGDARREGGIVGLAR